MTNKHEKMLNITNHQGNANQNHDEISPHTCQNSYHQKTTNNKCWQGCGENKGPPVDFGGNVNWCSQCSMKFPQKIKNKSTIQSSNSTSGYFSKENRNTNLKRYMHSYVHCSIICNSQDMEAT